MKFTPPHPIWYEGYPIIMAAFHYIPDFEEYPIYYWKIYYEAAIEMMKNGIKL
jgi:hypothetical protein